MGGPAQQIAVTIIEGWSWTTFIALGLTATSTVVGLITVWRRRGPHTRS